jgi:restriction system protein
LAETEPTVWGIHAGKTGDAETLFLKRNFVALGWDKVGDLSLLAPNRDAFKSRLLQVWPDIKPSAVANNAGQLYRFIHEMKEGDIVAYPSKLDRHIHLGRVEGPYHYDATLEQSYPHLRTVKWLRSVPRTNFPQGSLYEIGSAMSLFQIKNYVEPFRAALAGHVKTESPTDDDTVKEVAKDIEETTRDFILKRLGQELKGHPFADFVAHVLGTMGYRTRVSPPGPDGGVDIVAHRDELGFEPPIIKVQVKSNEGTIGQPVVAGLYGSVAVGEHALIVTLGTFTAQARNFERSKSNLRLIDGENLVALVLEHYDQFDSRYKGLLPMKRVYIPAPIDDTDA